MIFVTGGTGLVGSHLLFKLAQQHTDIRALYRSEEKLESVKHVFSYFTDDVESLFSNIEWVKGDILNIPNLQEHFKDVTTVYHCAALISFDPKDYNLLRKINIEGTANIVNLCVSNAIKKLCYVSSIAAIGNSLDGKEITETTPWNPDDDHNVYAITKYGAEIEVWRGTQEGVDAVIVNPGIILGGGFWRSGGSGSLFRKVQKGMSHYTTGKSGYVDVHDVIEIMTSLMNNHIKNERFIVVAENWSFKKFTEEVAQHLKVNPPKKEAKFWQLQLAWRMDWLRQKLLNKRRRLTKQLARSVVSKDHYSNKKITLALDYKFKDVKTSIKEVSLLLLKDF